jgi:hypothetical protein
LTSATDVGFLGANSGKAEGGRLTINGLALRQVVVVLAGEQRVAVAANNALDVAVEMGKHLENHLETLTLIHLPVFDIVEETFHDVPLLKLSLGGLPRWTDVCNNDGTREVDGAKPTY